MHVRRQVLALALVIVVASLAKGHPPEGKSDAPAQQPAAAQLPPALILPAIDGPKPWTDKPHFNDPDRFQIVIMTDNTGGHRPGIWQKAVERINWLRPEFVMSVGDLIEGYSTDRKKIEAEWKEFLGFMDKMEMKFFFVAGNHDVTNPLMHKIWREHFGPEWYSFDYKGVHFLCLSSDDPDTRIGEQQLQWIEEDLRKARDARWTLVFLHRPLWVDAERALKAGNPDKTNWKRVEQMLGTRPHTVFSGHVHYYSQYDRNGMKYYHLATTGGSSQMRGVPYGEFDHVAWLTMEKDGPHVANLMLDGIFPANVVTENSIGRFREFLTKTQLEVAPILLEDEGFLQGRIDLRLTNKFDKPVEVVGDIDGLPLRGLTVDPERLRLTAKPGETAELAVTVRFADRIAFQHLAETLLTAKFKSLDEQPPLTAERRLPVIIDRKYPLPKRTTPVLVDGKLDEWPKLEHVTGERPLVLDAAQNWKGPGDAGAEFAVAYDDRFLYVAAKVTDDRVLSRGDAVEVLLDARPMLDRRANSLLRAGAYRARIGAPSAEGQLQLSVRSFTRAAVPRGSQATGRIVPGGYEVELALPLDFLARHQSKNWHSVQLTLLVRDVDESTETPATILWRGTPDALTRNTNFGQFVRQ